jgi:hypothetical protein
MVRNANKLAQKSDHLRTALRGPNGHILILTWTTYKTTHERFLFTKNFAKHEHDQSNPPFFLLQVSLGSFPVDSHSGDNGNSSLPNLVATVAGILGRLHSTHISTLGIEHSHIHHQSTPTNHGHCTVHPHTNWNHHQEVQVPVPFTRLRWDVERHKGMLLSASGTDHTSIWIHHQETSPSHGMHTSVHPHNLFPYPCDNTPCPRIYTVHPPTIPHHTTSSMHQHHSKLTMGLTHGTRSFRYHVQHITHHSRDWEARIRGIRWTKLLRPLR